MKKIAYARQFYNRNVLAYKTLALTFPHTLIARIFHFQQEDFFEVDGVDRSPVAVNFERQEDD